MNRELIYVYIENLNECFINQGFNFSSNFEVKFDIENGFLIIDKKNFNVLDYFGNNKIRSINLIVGKNGSGKSSILDLIGSDKINRMDLMGNSTSNKWFAIYHLKDNYFVIEGNGIKILKNINGYNGIGNDYAIVIKNEDFNFLFVDLIENFNEEKDKLIYLYNATAPSEHWYSHRIITDGYDTQLGYHRRYLMKPLMKDVYKILNNSIKKIDKKFTGRNVVVRISKRDITRDIAKLESIDSIIKELKLYNSKVDILLINPDISLKSTKQKNKVKKWTAKKRFIIEFLEESIFYRIIDNREDLTNDDLEIINNVIYESSIDTYKSRIDYLVEILGVIDGSKKTNYLNSFKQSGYDYGKIISLLENLDENCYSKEFIVDHILDNKDKKNIIKIVEFFDETEEIREIFPLKIEFLNLSSGELQFIKQISNIFKTINIASSNKKIENIIILLDEPDTNFHPEWSRRYINNLINLLGSNNFESEIQFQIIITTHSPFMISDIPKQYITCIDVVEENGKMSRVVSKAEFGLMSNFYDLIKKNFFMEQPIGEYASKFFSRIISDINNLDVNYSKIEFENVEKKIELIDDPIIKSKLLNYLNQKSLGLISEEEKLIRKRERLLNELEKIDKELGND